MNKDLIITGNKATKQFEGCGMYVSHMYNIINHNVKTSFDFFPANLW